MERREEAGMMVRKDAGRSCEFVSMVAAFAPAWSRLAVTSAASLSRRQAGHMVEFDRDIGLLRLAIPRSAVRTLASFPGKTLVMVAFLQTNVALLAWNM